MTIGIPYSFVPGTKAKAEEVNANFISLYNSLDSKVNRDFSNLNDNQVAILKSTVGATFRNIGEITYSLVPLTDAGLHLLDGALLQGNGIYAQFVEYINDLYTDGNYDNIFCTQEQWDSSVQTYGVCAKFVYNSNDNTVRLPKITGIIEGTTDIQALSDLVEAGLPNIYGEFGLNGWACQWASDAFNITGAPSGHPKTSSTTSDVTGYAKANFDASTYNSIYGNSNTVQPQTAKLLIYITVATTSKTNIEVNIDNISNDLAYKADLNGTNLAPSVKNFDGEWTYCYSVIYNNKNAGTTDISLANILPDDGYNYEILLNSYVYNTSNLLSNFYISTQYGNGVRILANSVNSHAYYSVGNISIIVGTDRKITTYMDAAATNSCELRIVGYRRIGTNK